MRQRDSRRVRPRPHSRMDDNMPDTVPYKEPISPHEPPSDIIKKCINTERKPVDTAYGVGTTASLTVAERRTRSERYIDARNRFFLFLFSH